jgi:hypothetical protein
MPTVVDLPAPFGPSRLTRRDAERHGPHRGGAVRVGLAESLDNDRVASKLRAVVAAGVELHELVERALESVLHLCS